MASARTADETRNGEPLLPPDEKFWQRYSPHHELPVSSVGTIVLHGLVLAVIAIVSFVRIESRRDESHPFRPPSMDVVQFEGGGTGFEGGGGDPGPKGILNKEGRTEDVFGSPKPDPREVQKTEFQDQFKEIPSTPAVLPQVGSSEVPELDDSLKAIAREAELEVQKATKATAQAANVGKPEGGKIVGQNGQGGKGNGLGKGSRVGPAGKGGIGQPRTQAQIFADRWRFDPSGSGREHAAKLDAVGVFLAVPTPQGEFLLIRDLKRRPVELRRENLEPFKNAVNWFNVKPDSLAALAQELRLPFVPRYVVLLLPKDREQKMANAEAEYARSRGRDAGTVEWTWFDFRLRGGSFEPVVISQK